MAARARDVARQAGDSVHVSDGGTQAVAAISTAMQEIRERVDGMARDILTLSERTQQIGVITSTNAVAQVEAILNDVQDATDAAVSASDQGTEVVENGLVLAEHAGDGILSLTDTIREASIAAEEIAHLAHQQSVGMDQIAAAMGNIEDGTSQFLKGAEQSQATAEGLNGLAAKLAGLTERYRV